ncbi:ubiquitin thioesterase OTUB2 isoform X2 [Mixophyes fleayi]|uniref:ubiquitin thioesterase OTUB2 isoform X2 n=1 Tax=Mixophyes fleayi TaxID=3061075 RepID=UPI003F4DE9BF
MTDLEQLLPTRGHPKYELNLDIRKRNVFVTQLEEGRDEEEENITQIPIIKEAAGKLLDSSKNTLQKTLVLKKEVEYDRVSQELVNKRDEVAERMGVLDARKEEFALKQKDYSEKAIKFEKFLKDSDAKRRRAIVKWQAESRQNEFRQIEIDELAKQLEEKRIRQQRLHVRVKKHKIYDDFLLQMVEKVPDNYLEYGVDTPVKAIIRRYEALSITNENLVNNLTVLADELESAQHRLDAMKREHDTSKLMMTSELSQLQLEYDKLQEKNKQLELSFNLEKSQFRNQSVEIGSLLLAVINLADQCQMKHHGPLAEAELGQKLDMIKEYILEKIQIEKLAKNPYEEIQGTEEHVLKQTKMSNKESKKIIPSNKNVQSEDSFDFVSEKCDIVAFIEEQAGDPLFQRKLKDLQATYCAVRKIRSDGSCFYRGLGFAYLESLLGKPEEIVSIVDLAEKDCSVSNLLAAFNHPYVSDGATQYLRLVTSAFLRNRAEFYQPFVEDGLHILDFCTQHVEPMTTVCDHIQIMALTQALDVPLQVEYVDSLDTPVNHHVFPEGAAPSIYMLYTQDHYSLLYRAQSPEEI